MRRIIGVLLATLVLLPVANGVFAQEEEEEEQWLRIPYRVTVTVDAGIGMPLRPEAFNDLWNASFPASVSLGFVVIPRIEIKGWFTFAQWSISEIPAKNAIGIAGVTEISGGSVRTMLYGASAKIIPFPNSRIMPFVEIGGGLFQASGDDIEISRDNAVVYSTSMEDDNGPVFNLAGGMEYGVNERWNVFAAFKYYLGISDTFSPASLIQQPNATVPPASGNLSIATIVLGLTLKL